ncbi:MAG: isochorismate synthase [Thermomicrobiales bacterium]|nr:isochorismate synthase [Thermomicrobiales bacterium]
MTSSVAVARPAPNATEGLNPSPHRLLSLVIPVAEPGAAVSFLRRASAELGGGVLWAQPESGTAFAGAGVAEAFTFQGVTRFADASAAIRDLRARVQRQDIAPFPLLGGFAFDPVSRRDAAWEGYPDGRLVVPRVLLQVTPAGAHLRVTGPASDDVPEAVTLFSLASLLARAQSWLAAPAPMCVPALAHSAMLPQDRDDWVRQVAAAIRTIRAGTMSKVVLARGEVLQAQREISAEAALTCLGEEHPGATLFAIASDDAWFIGATPERLVRLRDGLVDVNCLAGSVAMGRTPEESARLGQQLLASDKNRREHEIVVESTIAALETACSEVTRTRGTPRLRPARSVQHLETPLTATARPETDVLQLAGLLHPTPAVGGFPTAPALELIRELEPFDRGWYAGPVGWVDLDGSGEFSVAIRSALLRGRSAVAYAGCGIVANSDPEAEFTETELKLRPMMAALGGA